MKKKRIKVFRLVEFDVEVERPMHEDELVKFFSKNPELLCTTTQKSGNVISIKEKRAKIEGVRKELDLKEVARILYEEHGVMTRTGWINDLIRNLRKI